MNRGGAPESSSTGAEPAWVGQVLRYWFEEVTESEWFAASRESMSTSATGFWRCTSSYPRRRLCP